MKKLLLLAFLLLIAIPATAADVTFVWENPNPPGLVAGYEISWSTDSSDPKEFHQTFEIPRETPLTATVSLPNGRYWMAIRCYSQNINHDGGVVLLYSDFSNVIEVKVVGRPVNLKLQP